VSEPVLDPEVRIGGAIPSGTLSLFTADPIETTQMTTDTAKPTSEICPGMKHRRFEVWDSAEETGRFNDAVLTTFLSP
jgi:hypothetical protein